ncbi:MAG: hypothetical protein PQJ50_07560 [Spirochaetales bacterium]|nr:hypothetical protein [Spirochaetales bacterium]
MSVVKEYDTKLDSKNRFTIRMAKYDHFHVTEYDDGHIELSPRVLVDPNMISKNTLGMMDQAMDNFNKGKVSAAIDLSEFDED